MGGAAGDVRAYELYLLAAMAGRAPDALVDAALYRLRATRSEMRRENRRVNDRLRLRPGGVDAWVGILSGARIEGSRTTDGSRVSERHRFATWPDFEYEIEYDTGGMGWGLNRAEFVRAAGSVLPDGPPAPWTWLKAETLGEYEVLREIDTWGSYDSYAVRDRDGAYIFLSFSHGLFQEVAPLEVLDGQPVAQLRNDE
ncbi:hypothetical protein AB0M39_31350 [Streptomyces sp. NPDC051907]|uniref:hypothetical protein n=1 Tax=Streptomyces sp. NPDC051907 TaxID=3155284 RepID=UPI003424CA81